MKHYMLSVSIALSIQTAVIAQTQTDNNIHIAIGKQTEIIYHLQHGTYSLMREGKTITEHVYAIGKGIHEYDSRKAITHTCTQTKIKTNIGEARLYTITHKTKEAQLQQLFYVYPGKDYCITELRIADSNNGCYYMSPVNTGRFTLHSAGDNRVLSMPFDNDMWFRYDARSMQSADLTSSEATALYNNDNNNGIVIGSLEHDVWKSAIKITSEDKSSLSSLSVFGGYTDSLITHDQRSHGIVLPVNGYCRSPQFMIGFFTDWRQGMETFAQLNMLCGKRYVAAWKQAKPMGWNSWGVIQDKISYDKAIAVTDYLHDSCRSFRNADNSLFIDLDSYWDNMVEGGIDGNTGKLQSFAAYCHKKGFKPGIYWAPFVDWGKYNRKIEGSSEEYENTWTRQQGKVVDTDGGRAMDPTHPGTRERIKHYLSRFKEMGFEMIKIDFLSHGAIESDRFYDKTVTTGMQAYRKGMELIDSVLDGSMLIYAAISPNLATARYVHMRRIACDAFSAIDNTEYTLNSTGYGWWQGNMYDYIDADHVVFTEAPDNMNRARLVSAVVTGTLTIGDDYSRNGKWKKTAQQLLQHPVILTLARNAHSFRPVQGNTGNKGVHLFTQKVNGVQYLAAFNFSNQAQTFTIPVKKLKLPGGHDIQQLTNVFGKGSSSTGNNSITLQVEAEDAVIYEVK